ncbi:MAG: dipeptidase [Thermoleophilaceae bacterium]
MLAIFDGHNDALTRADYARIASGRKGGHLDLPRMRAGGLRGGIFAIFTRSAEESEEPVARDDGVFELPLAPRVDQGTAAAHATTVAGRLLQLERAGHVRIARAEADFDDAPDGNGPPLAVMHLEGAEAIDPQLEALDHWYAAGLRSLGLVWSRGNDFAHGVPFMAPSSPDTGPGLTRLGKKLARRCAELGVLVDVSHLNEKGFWDLAKLDAGPLVATHSGVHALCQSTRNLTDGQLDAIGASDGLVGIVFACPFLRADFRNDEDTPLELIVEHARYVADRIGPRHVALGSDFDGATIPRPLGDAAGLPKLVDAFRRAGFSDDELAAIAWDNWRRVFAAWWR